MKKNDILSKLDKKDTNGLSTTDKDRFLYLNGFIDEEKAKETIERLLELQNSDPLDEITMIINSGGGEVYSMFAITDMMDLMPAPIRTICLGSAMSAAGFVFICGTKGKRFMVKHSSLMIHQVSGGAYGTSKDIDIQVDEIKFLQKEMVKEIANRSELTEEEVQKFIDRDFYIRPAQSIEFGLCDGIIERLS